MFDTIIKNGIAVTASDTCKTDIGIKDEKITAIAANLSDDKAAIIDASNQYVFPGAVDAHTHLDMPLTETLSSKDDFFTGTRAAALGGTTTIIDFCTPPKGFSLKEGTQIWHEKAKQKAVIDYGFHIAITEMRPELIGEIPAMIAAGYPSFKLYMAYDELYVNDGFILQALAATKEHGGLIFIHAENYYAVKYLTAKLLAAGKTAPKYHPLSRPPLVEAEATSRATKLALLLDAPLYVAHVTCKESLQEIKRARKKSSKIMGETCVQYLLLAKDKYNLGKFEAAKYVIAPPLRSKSDQNALWRALKEGTLLTVSTDHCPFDFKGQKELGRDDFSKIPNGAAGIETRLPLLFEYGVNRKKITLNELVAITATNPAKTFGLPQKGSIAVGADADLVLFDPNLKKTLSVTNLHQNVDYTPYEGFTVTGYPTTVLNRGNVVVKNGVFVGQAGAGRFLPRLANFYSFMLQ